MSAASSISLSLVPQAEDSAKVVLFAPGSMQEKAFIAKSSKSFMDNQMITYALRANIEEIFFCRICQTIFALLPSEWFEENRGVQATVPNVPKKWVETFVVEFFAMSEDVYAELEWVDKPLAFEMGVFLFSRGYHFLSQFFSQHALPQSILHERKPLPLTFCIGENLKRNPCLFVTKKTDAEFASMKPRQATGPQSETVIHDLAYAMHVCMKILNDRSFEKEEIIKMIQLMRAHVTTSCMEEYLDDEDYEDLEQILAHVANKTVDQEVCFWHETQDMIWGRNYKSPVCFSITCDKILIAIGRKFAVERAQMKTKKPSSESWARSFDEPLPQETLPFIHEDGSLKIATGLLAAVLQQKFPKNNDVVLYVEKLATIYFHLSESEMEALLKEKFSEKFERTENYVKLLNALPKNCAHNKAISIIQKDIDQGKLPRGQSIFTQLSSAISKHNANCITALKIKMKSQTFAYDIIINGLNLYTNRALRDLNDEFEPFVLVNEKATTQSILQYLDKHFDYNKMVAGYIGWLKDEIIKVFGQIDIRKKAILKQEPQISPEQFLSTLIARLKGSSFIVDDEILKNIKKQLKELQAKNPNEDIVVLLKNGFKEAFKMLVDCLTEFLKENGEKEKNQLRELLKQAAEKSLLYEAEEIYKTFFFSGQLKHYSPCDLAVRYEIIEFLQDSNGWAVGPAKALHIIKAIWAKKYPNFPFNEQHAHFFILELYKAREP